MKTVMFNHNNIRFHCREKTSDEKTFKEVIVKNAYQKKFFKIESGEKWIDLGGNVGAFAVLAGVNGAEVISYEPDQFNCQMINKNNQENNLIKNKIINAAVVNGNKKTTTMNVWTEGQYWRNSIVRNKKGTSQTIVDCVNFWEQIKEKCCVKMDIEGSEIEILSNWPEKTNVQKMVFEWSFDVDNKTSTLIKAIDRLKKDFKNIKVTSQIYSIEKWNFFPAATNVFCWK